MTAQLAALQDIHEGQHISIYTDSKCSIQYLQKWILNPGSFDQHKHGDLLFGICEAIADRSGEVHIYKIPAHVGHPGNEAADKQAKRGARGEEGREGVALRGTEGGVDEHATRAIRRGVRLTRVKAQLRDPVAKWLAKRYGYGTELHDLWTTENPDIDPKPSSSHWNMYRPVVQSLLKHPFRMRTGV